MTLIPNTVPYYNDKYNKRALHSFNPENRRRFYKVMELVKGHRILDIACGEGVLVNLLAGKGHDAVGVDFSPVAIARAKRGEYSPAGSIKTIGKFYVMDIRQELNFQARSFDTVCICETIEHFKDPRFLFLEALRLLSRPGRIVLTTPAYKKDGHPEHELDFTRESLLKLITPFGEPCVIQLSELHFIAYIDVYR